MKNKISIFFIIIVAFSFYFLTIRGERGNFDEQVNYKALTDVGQPFESSHERSPYAMFLAMRQNHTVELNTDLANFASPDVGYINKKFYSFFPAGIPVLIGPLYDLGSRYDFGLLGAYFTMAVLSVISLVLLFKISRNIFKLPVWASLLASLIFGFTSTYWSYALVIYQHAATAAFMLISFYAAWKFTQSRNFGWFWATVSGAIYGLAIFIDYPNALLFAPIAVYLVFSAFGWSQENEHYKLAFRSSVLLGVIVFGFICVGHLYYNYKVFGHALQFHNPAPRYTPETFEQLQQRTADGITKPSTALSIFNEFSLVNGGYELLVAPDKGLFVFSPIFLFALLGIWHAAKKGTKEIWFLFITAFANIFLYASFGDPWGGWAYGPRYIIPAMAILSLFAVYGLVAIRYSVLSRVVFLGLLAYSAATAVLGVLTTNLVPPKVEAVYLGLKYGFVRNIDFLRDNVTGGYVYNTYFRSGMPLIKYGIIIFAVILFIALVLLFIMPYIEKEKYEH